MGTIILFILLALGVVLLFIAGIRIGIAPAGEKHGPVGLALIGAILYGIPGSLLWHWAVGLTTFLMFAVLAFAVFSTKEALNG
ncbi:hypothetical protein [Pseudaestuariivita rosea]|uniref:hypothetical protein n=1 Tax=Pseudaestuariivita rosea TaxID=2763263 RepID=UPI001ABA708D|nr:hypothetical protein [Pseudaestuariivita rosea]